MIRGHICPGSRGEADVLKDVLEVGLGDVLVGVMVHVLMRTFSNILM